MSDLDGILRDCQESPTLLLFSAIFRERFRNSRNKEDIDRAIFALRGCLRFTTEQGFTDEIRQATESSLAEYLLMKIRLIHDANDVIDEEGNLTDLIPLVSEVSMRYY